MASWVMRQSDNTQDMTSRHLNQLQEGAASEGLGTVSGNILVHHFLLDLIELVPVDMTTAVCGQSR